MPRCLEPGAVLEIVLDFDQDKPADKRPTFITKVQSMRDTERLGTLLDALPECKSTPELYQKITDALSDVLVGWRHMVGPDGEIPFDLSKLKDILTTDEAWELVRKVLAQGRVNDDEKKS